MDDKIVLICATGRSGSTTLQRIINSIPNSNICGENFGAINSLLEYYRRIKITTYDYIPGNIKPISYNNLIDKNIKPSWYNSYNYSNIIFLIRNMIINLFKNTPETNLWGFKEIRYDNGKINFIKEFKELFPQTKVILLIRENIVKQSQSSWHKNDPNALQYLIKSNKELIDFQINNSEWCHLLTFERMFNMNNLLNVFRFIGCEEYFDEKKITCILNNNIKD